jgi:ferritin-like metal-binding protein YciE
MQGLIEEVENFKEKQPSPDILDVFMIGAAAKVESYEIHAYEDLIQLGTDMGHKKAVRLLQQNLREEQQTLKKMEGFAKKIKPERSGMEEEEEQETERGSRSRSSRGRSRKAA